LKRQDFLNGAIVEKMKKFRRLAEIGEALKLSVEDRPITGFAIDSRQVKVGDLFFALQGAKFNGHDFLKEVAGKGAVAAVVEAGFRGESGGLVLLRVDDVPRAMQELARLSQAKREQRVVAVTGSLGKTTTKEFIATLLAQKYTVAKTPGNNNSQVGMPLAILNGSGEEEVFVVEMGMWRAGEIRRLVEIAPPEIAVITKIGFPHIEAFSNGLDGVAAAKAEIFSHPRTTLGVVGIKALDYAVIRDTGSFPKKSFGVAPLKANFVLEEGRLVQDEDEMSPPLRLPFSETHLCENFVGAASVARLMGLSWQEIALGAKLLKAVTLRYEKVQKQGITFINDCYNASPESMEAAFVNLPRPTFGGKTIAVIGEMTCGLGSYSEGAHRKVAEQALEKVDHLLCYGKGCLPMIEMFSDAGRPAEFFHDLLKLRTTLMEISKPGDIVLIKGSNSNQLWQILEQI
jgi:UDP-N-acetylmuramoyl-tripeptide--D-alanyl-D-alanine ligase